MPNSPSAGTVGYRFSEHFWFEGDVTWIDAAAGGVRDYHFDIDGRQEPTCRLRDMLARHAGTVRVGADCAA